MYLVFWINVLMLILPSSTKEECLRSDLFQYTRIVEFEFVFIKYRFQTVILVNRVSIFSSGNSTLCCADFYEVDGKCTRKYLNNVFSLIFFCVYLLSIFTYILILINYMLIQHLQSCQQETILLILKNKYVKE